MTLSRHGLTLNSRGAGRDCVNLSLGELSGFSSKRNEVGSATCIVFGMVVKYTESGNVWFVLGL